MHGSSQFKLKPEEIADLYGIRTHDLCSALPTELPRQLEANHVVSSSYTIYLHMTYIHAYILYLFIHGKIFSIYCNKKFHFHYNYTVLQDCHVGRLGSEFMPLFLR